MINKDNTTVVDGAGDEDAIQGRCTQIRQQVEESSSDYDKEKLQERLAKLSDGVAVIKVGAATEVEMKEKKARVEDAYTLLAQPLKKALSLVAAWLWFALPLKLTSNLPQILFCLHMHTTSILALSGAVDVCACGLRYVHSE